VVFVDFISLFGSSRRASLVVLPSSSSPGQGLLDPFGDFPSATNNVRPTQGGAAAAARRRHSLEVEDKGLLKDLVVIFFPWGALFCSLFLLMPESYLAKKKIHRACAKSSLQ
jgi:hypothetical protein